MLPDLHLPGLLVAAGELRSDDGRGHGPRWLAGDGTAVTSIAAARGRAVTAASLVGLHPGEVIRLDNGFYPKLKDAAGHAATEVLVNLVTAPSRPSLARR